MTTARINDVELYYESYGRGLPVVLTEGFAGTTAMWAPQVKAVSDKRRLVLYDIRGQGRSGSPRAASAYSLDLAVDDLYQLLRQLGAEQAVVGGLSLGGYISLHFYRAHPEMVRALVLADTGPGYRNPERRRQWQEECEERARLLETGGTHAFAHSAWAADDYYAPHAALLRLDPLGLANVGRGIMSSAWGVELLSQIRVPTLILCGEHDTPFLAATDYMAGVIPGARKVIIPNACHASNLDNADAFNAALLAFLDEIGV